MNEKVLYGTKEITLDLTGKGSHKVTIGGGQGSFTIAKKDTTIKYYDVIVDEKEILNWEAFNGFYTMAEWEEKYEPYGNWPRFFEYYGNDIGFVKWSKKRKIESFVWIPDKNNIVDLKKANIDFFKIILNSCLIELTIGKSLSMLELHGNLQNIKIKECEKIPFIRFNPEYAKNLISYSLPKYKSLKEATKVSINVTPVSPPFDCKSLLQFPKLKTLYLTGNMTNLSVLKELKYLEEIGLWDMPNLAGMPSLKEFSNLKEFIAISIEKEGGDILKKELKELKKIKTFEFTAVEKLRSPLWFKTNYEIPFTDWEKPKEQKAIKAYKMCLKSIKKAKTKEELKEYIWIFVNRIKGKENLETNEREDIYKAINLLLKNSTFKVSSMERDKWLDEIYDF